MKDELMIECFFSCYLLYWFYFCILFYCSNMEFCYSNEHIFFNLYLSVANKKVNKYFFLSLFFSINPKRDGFVLLFWSLACTTVFFSQLINMKNNWIVLINLEFAFDMTMDVAFMCFAPLCWLAQRRKLLWLPLESSR